MQTACLSHNIIEAVSNGTVISLYTYIASIWFVTHIIFNSVFLCTFTTLFVYKWYYFQKMLFEVRVSEYMVILFPWYVHEAGSYKLSLG